MRKFKQKKIAERRKVRRNWICKQIESGNMDKNCLALVYSRKALPFEKKSQEIITNSAPQIEQGLKLGKLKLIYSFLIFFSVILNQYWKWIRKKSLQKQ